MKNFIEALQGMEKGQIWERTSDMIWGSIFFKLKNKQPHTYEKHEWKTCDVSLACYLYADWQWVADSEEQWEYQKEIEKHFENGGKVDVELGNTNLLYMGTELNWKNNYYKKREEPLKMPHPNSLWMDANRCYTYNIQHIVLTAIGCKDDEAIKIAGGWHTIENFYSLFTCIFDGTKFLNKEIGKKFDMGEK